MGTKIPRRSEQNELAGSGTGQGAWIRGLNCVYESSDPEFAYRVAIKANSGWVHLGHFNSRGVAAYVANVAILTTPTGLDFELNAIDEKDTKELEQWRRIEHNRSIETIAREIFDRRKASEKAAEDQRQILRKEIEERYAAVAESRAKEEKALRERRDSNLLLRLSIQDQPLRTLAKIVKDNPVNSLKYKFAMEEILRRKRLSDSSRSAT